MLLNLLNGILSQVVWPLQSNAIYYAYVSGSGVSYKFTAKPANSAIPPISHPGVVEDPVASHLSQRDLLLRAYPNPANPTTMIAYDLPASVNVTLEIFDILGRTVRLLVNDNQRAGRHSVQWDGTDDAGRAVVSGTYVYRMTAGGHMQSKKIRLLK